MGSREPCRASLRMQPVVERRPNGDDTTTRTSPGFQDDDRCPGLVKKISGTQSGETGADDDNGLVGIERLRGDASNGSRGERQSTRHLLKKPSAIHVPRSSADDYCASPFRQLPPAHRLFSSHTYSRRPS